MFDILDNFSLKPGIAWGKCIEICRDGACYMSGCYGVLLQFETEARNCSGLTVLFTGKHSSVNIVNNEFMIKLTTLTKNCKIKRRWKEVKRSVVSWQQPPGTPDNLSSRFSFWSLCQPSKLHIRLYHVTGIFFKGTLLVHLLSFWEGISRMDVLPDK